jgi:Rrf2 family protein
MQGTRASSYAQHALVNLAARTGDVLVPSRVSAHAEGISELFLWKLLLLLAHIGILLSVQGPAGGYRLPQPASRIPVLDGVEAVDGPIRGAAPASAGAPTLHERLQDLWERRAVPRKRLLERVRIGDLADQEA